MNIDFNFKVDKYVLLQFLLEKGFYENDLATEIKKFKNSFWEQYPELYEKIRKSENSRNLSKQLDSNEKAVINVLFQTEILQQVYNETVEHLDYIKKDWQEKKNSVNTILSYSLRIQKNDITDVYIVHPAMHGGRTNEGKYVIWGHDHIFKDPYYNVVYLTHEYLHTLFKSSDEYLSKNYALVHAIIELITDKNLYLQLGGHNPNGLAGHESLDKYRKHLKSSFDEYLLQPDKNIYDFITSSMENKSLKSKISLETAKEEVKKIVTSLVCPNNKQR